MRAGAEPLPDELSAMGDAALFEVINRIIAARVSGTGAESTHRLACVPFLTKELLRRTHDRVIELINRGDVARGTLQVTIALLILHMVGMQPPTEHWALQKVGNQLELTLTRYLKARTTLKLRFRKNAAAREVQLRSLGEERLTIPWAVMEQTNAPLVVPDTVARHARDSRGFASLMELQKVRAASAALAAAACRHACRDLGWRLLRAPCACRCCLLLRLLPLRLLSVLATNWVTLACT